MVSKRNDLKRPRPGRPPKDLAGDVKARILDAAQRVFLKRGYQSASLDEIAEAAPASKPTIYAHFPGKEALFEAVVARVIEGLTDFEGFAPKGRSVQDRLTSLGIEVVERFIDETIGITRATIAEADRFPALSRQVHEHGRDRAAAAVSHVLNDATHILSRRKASADLRWHSFPKPRVLLLCGRAGRAGRSETRSDRNARHLGERVEGFAFRCNGGFASANAGLHADFLRHH